MNTEKTTTKNGNLLIFSVIGRFIKKHHKIILWIGVCVGMAFTEKYGAIAEIITYLYGVIVGYVCWGKNAL